MIVNQVLSPKVASSHTGQSLAGTRDPILGTLASTVSDLEAIRISLVNRLYSLTHEVADVDGVVRGYALPDDDPSVEVVRELVRSAEELEKKAIKALQNRMKSHVLYPWVEANKGVGSKTAARLLSALGDPYMKEQYIPEGEEFRRVYKPRSVSELWSYAGYGVIDGKAPARSKGTVMNWNPEVRMRTYLIAETSVKCNGTYKPVYDEAKKHALATPHALDCHRCKAKAGEPLGNGHAHARALRRVSKEVLKDLWTLSKEWHESN